MTSYMMSMNCVWLLITGGYNTASLDCVSGANIAMNIELGIMITIMIIMLYKLQNNY